MNSHTVKSVQKSPVNFILQGVCEFIPIYRKVTGLLQDLVCSCRGKALWEKLNRYKGKPGLYSTCLKKIVEQARFYDEDENTASVYDGEANGED